MLYRDKPWDRSLQFFLVGILGFSLLPHVTFVPIWVSAIAAVCILWKTLYLMRGWPLPRRSLLAVASVFGAGGILATYFTIFGQDAAGALLVVMASLKLLETNRYRDAMLVIFTSYFLLMVYLLEAQSLNSTIFMLIDVAIITSLMLKVHRTESGQRGHWLAPTMKLLTPVIPIWILIFVFFPRFSTGIWNLQPAKANVGFSDSLDPGSVSQIADSDEPAFRATFPTPLGLSPESLYWRGTVLTVGDGLKWTRSRGRSRAESYIPSPNAEVRLHNIWLEAGFQKWIFALEVPVAISSNDSEVLEDVRRMPGFTFEFTRPRHSRAAYTVRSVHPTPLQILSDSDRAATLHLPPALDPRIVELARSLRNGALTSPDLERYPPEEKIARNIMNWFMLQGFRYTKRPGAMKSKTGPEQLAEFLFEKRLGFCEHFAGAFATLARASGVPARVVIGFQGASANELGNYWLVRKMDAHAWAEVWRLDPSDSSRGQWVRFDPTESIAPLRLQLGGEYNRLDSTAVAGASKDELERRLHGGIGGLYRQAQLFADFAQMKWNSFLLSYDSEYQLRLLGAIGGTGLGPYVLGGILVLIIIAATALLIWIQSRRARHEDVSLREWRRFCERLAIAGLARKPNEGPVSFSKRASEKFPKNAEQIRRIADCYVVLRYGSADASSESPSESHSDTRLRLRQLVRGFSIPDKARPASS